MWCGYTDRIDYHGNEMKEGILFNHQHWSETALSKNKNILI
jgi:hypothetical protein